MKRTDPLVDRVFPDRNRFVFLLTPEVAIHRLANQGSDTHAAPECGVAQLAISLLREAQVGDDVAGHGVSRYRDIANVASGDLTLLLQVET
jgi:hypothetical protein